MDKETKKTKSSGCNLAGCLVFPLGFAAALYVANFLAGYYAVVDPVTRGLIYAGSALLLTGPLSALIFWLVFGAALGGLALLGVGVQIYEELRRPGWKNVK